MVQINLMPVVLQSTTNKLAECLVGRECKLHYGITAYFEYDPTGLEFDYRKGVWSTSIIENIKIEEVSINCFDITIDTANSQYVFRHGELSDKKPLTKKEKLDLQIALGMHLF